MTPRLPADVARCRGVATDTGDVCSLRESCLRYLAVWGHWMTYFALPAEQQGDDCEHYISNTEGSMTPDQVPDDAAERFIKSSWGVNPPYVPGLMKRAKRYIAYAHNALPHEPEPTEETHVLARFAAAVDARGYYYIQGSHHCTDDEEKRAVAALAARGAQIVAGTVWLPRPVAEEVRGKIVQEGRVDEQ